MWKMKGNPNGNSAPLFSPKIWCNEICFNTWADQMLLYDFLG